MLATKKYVDFSTKTHKNGNIMLFHHPIVNFINGWRLFKFWKNIIASLCDFLGFDTQITLEKKGGN